MGNGTAIKVVEGLRRLDQEFKSRPGQLLIAVTPQKIQQVQGLKRVYTREGSFSDSDLGCVTLAGRHLRAGKGVIVENTGSGFVVWVSPVSF